MKWTSFLLCLATLAASVTWQLDARNQAHEHHSAYADQTDSGFASLSVSEVEQLLQGTGMGFARAAELNRYPGPRHVLDAATELGLNAEQRAATERIFEEMRVEAVRLGEEIVAKERILSRRFEHRHVDDATVRDLTAEIAVLEGQLRFVHLRAHLRMAEILTEEQITAYDVLRGYSGSSDPSGAG